MKIFIVFVSSCFVLASCNGKKYSSKKLNDFIAKDTIQTSNTEMVAANSLKATVMIVMEDENHRELAYGSGVIIDNNKIVTNKHVIENASFGKVKKYGSDSTYSIMQILAIDSLNDLAILEISNLHKEVNIKFDTTRPNIGKKVYAVGNPKGLEGTFSEGIVSGIRFLKDSLELIQISAPISPGSSGGQIIDEKNQIIGIAVGGIVEGQNLNFAIPSKYLISLISRPQTPLQLSTIKGSKTKQMGQKEITQSTEEILVKNVYWYEHSGQRTSEGVNPLMEFSIYNGLEKSISDINLLFILYDRDSLPVDYSYFTVSISIPPKLAKNIINTEINGRTYTVGKIKLDKKYGYRCEIRILDFSIDKE